MGLEAHKFYNKLVIMMIAFQTNSIYLKATYQVIVNLFNFFIRQYVVILIIVIRL